MRTSTRWRRIGAVVALGLVGFARADLQPEIVGKVRTLPETPGAHWFWLSDIMLHRTALFDADSGDQLGVITAGTPGVGFIVHPHFSRDHREIYIAESYFARGVRGERTDVVTIYDGQTLKPVHEIGIPAKRAEYFPGNASSALSDDGRFLAVFNLTPAQSVTIVDVQKREFSSEIPTPGCSLVYPAGPRRFLMLCGNGAALAVRIDDTGKEVGLERTAPFFDPQNDPVTEKAVRRGQQWLFPSFEGKLHAVDVGLAGVHAAEPVTLVGDDDRKAGWRIGGAQHLALHEKTGRLYLLMHQGKPDTHKDPGTEIWVYDLATNARVQRIPVDNPLTSFVRLMGKIGTETMGDRLTRWALDRTLPNPGADRILVTQDEKPVLIVSASMPPAVTIYDAITGAVVNEISEPGLGSSLLFAP